MHSILIWAHRLQFVRRRKKSKGSIDNDFMNTLGKVQVESQQCKKMYFGGRPTLLWSSYLHKCGNMFYMFKGVQKGPQVRVWAFLGQMISWSVWHCVRYDKKIRKQGVQLQIERTNIFSSCQKIQFFGSSPLLRAFRYQPCIHYERYIWFHFVLLSSRIWQENHPFNPLVIFFQGNQSV